MFKHVIELSEREGDRVFAPGPESFGSFVLSCVNHHVPLPMELPSDRTPTLTKKDLARRVSTLLNEPLYRSEPWVHATIEALRDLMAEADPEVRIELRDFGVFEVKKTRAKPKARNPKTNETVFIPARRKTHFKPSKKLRESLQKPLEDLGYSIPEGSAEPPTNATLPLRRAA